MPIIKNSTYIPPFGLKNPHLQSVLPQILRSVKGVTYTRERISTPDNDFLDLDWCSLQSDRCVILLHGLEGTTRRAYTLGMAKAFNRRGWNSVSVSFRGCSGEPNRQLRSYHHGVSDDLHTVVQHVLTKGYKKISIIGFSLGGNVLLKYLGENVFPVPEQLVGSVAISAPCDLGSCATIMDQKNRAFYTRRFLRMLHSKIIAKKTMFPEQLNDDNYSKITTFKEYDDRYTAPIHGFKNAQDYYARAASLQFLDTIKSPVLLINAKDDPFLTPQCSPEVIASKSNYLYLETPEHGGHVGFISFNKANEYWHETRAVSFVESFLL